MLPKHTGIGSPEQQDIVVTAQDISAAETLQRLAAAEKQIDLLTNGYLDLWKETESLRENTVELEVLQKKHNQVIISQARSLVWTWTTITILSVGFLLQQLVS